MSHYPLAHRIQVPARPYRSGANVAETIKAAKKKGPLVGGPVEVVVVKPYDLSHPDHPRHLGPLI